MIARQTRLRLGVQPLKLTSKLTSFLSEPGFPRTDLRPSVTSGTLKEV
jgi:hypothetical protein